MFPGGHFALRVNGALHFVVGRGAIEIVLHVVFAGPQDLDGLAGGFCHLCRFHYEISLIAAAEASAHQCGVHVYFFRRQPGNFGDHLLRPLRGLRGNPGFRAVGPDVHGAVHRLHAGMGGERQLVDDFNFL